MGTCFGCCPSRKQRKKSLRNKFVQAGLSNETSQDDQELLEMEQKTEDMIGPIEDFSGVVTKPTKLVFKKSHFNWLKNDNHIIPGSLHNVMSPADSVMPLLHGESAFAETCSFSSNQRWERISFAATPGSSVDLEWENEIGFANSPNLGATEEFHWMVLTENTNTSFRSSPVSVSNGLEWDGDFCSIDVSELATETPNLTVDMEENVENMNTFRDDNDNS